ncbi:MAG: RNA 2',3'-cyclic phosphodiesterase [Acidobacteriota bacterium]|nr:RNA 2',3'-cyclic phosphodiesterase [Acidobacteriota bacterium]
MRLFLATHFPAAVLAELNTRVAQVRPRLPSASWVREETQHLTFAFLGEQSELLIDDLAPRVREAVAAVPRFAATLHGSGFFPNPRRARVGWIGLEPEARFIDVANAVRVAVTASGVTLDRADFRPHLTLMRIRDAWPPASTELFTRTFRDYRSEPFTIDAVTLFSSQLNPNGAVHTALQKFALA